MSKNISEIRKKWFIQQAERLKAAGTTYAEIAEKMGVLPQYLNGILKADRPASEKMVSRFCELFDVNPNSLYQQIKGYDKPFTDEQMLNEGTPLIPIEAVAGYGRGDVTVLDSEIKERYSVPEFDVRGVKFLIRVSGSSMYPKYSNGDVLACKPITDVSFFQWGKVYVLDTDQGALVKRLFPGDGDGKIECRSDNKEHYPPFQMYKSSIRSVYIVVGVIRLE